MPSREAIAIPFVSNAGTVFLEILLHRVLFLLGAKATNTFLPRNVGHTFDSRGQSWHIHHSPRDPISPGSAERQSRSRSTNDTSLPSPPRANNVGGSAALHAAASWGASEVALPERSPAAAACNLLRPQTSTAFKDSQPRPVARVVALPPLLSPPLLLSAQCSSRRPCSGVAQGFSKISAPLIRNIVSPWSLHLHLNIFRLQTPPAELLSLLSNPAPSLSV